jgi:hypothetical protein
MQSKKAIFIAALCWTVAGAVYAKLPALADEQKAKSEETKAKAADAAKKDAEALTRAQDRVATGYAKAQKAKGITVKPTPIVAAAPAAAPPAAPAPAKK